MTQPDIWYSYRDNNPAFFQGTPCHESYDGDDPEGTAAGICPQLFPELFTGGVGPHGATTYEFDPNNPSETKFPPYYDGATLLGEFTQDTMREIRFDSNNQVLEINPFLNCGGGLLDGLPVRVRQPDGPAVRGRRELLPAHLRRRLLRGQRRRRHVPVGVHEGPAASACPGQCHAEERPGAADGAVQQRGLAATRTRATRSRFAWDFDNDGTVDSTDPNPRFTYTANGVYTARLTVTDSTGRSASASTVITVGNTAPTLTINTPLDGDFFTFGQNIPFTVTGSDPEDGAIDTQAECARVVVTFVLVHDTHGHAEDSTPATWDPAASVCRGVLTTDAGDASHGGYLAGGISASFTDTAQGAIPALETTTQHVLQLRRHELEDAQESFGLSSAAAEGTRAVSAAEEGDWVALNNRINLTNMDKTIAIRYGAGAAGVAAGTPRAAVEIRQGSPTGTLLQTIPLNATGAANNNTYATTSASLNFTGSQRLFLVFRAVTGGPTTNIANINWVEFSGPGVTP